MKGEGTDKHVPDFNRRVVANLVRTLAEMNYGISFPRSFSEAEDIFCKQLGKYTKNMASGSFSFLTLRDILGKSSVSNFSSFYVRPAGRAATFSPGDRGPHGAFGFPRDISKNPRRPGV